MSYKDFPPHPFFMTVLRHQPDCALFYAKIWSERDKECKLSVDKKCVFAKFLVTPQVFKRKVAYLMEEGLLSIQETPYYFEIEFIQYEEEPPEEASETKLGTFQLTFALTVKHAWSPMANQQLTFSMLYATISSKEFLFSLTPMRRRYGSKWGQSSRTLKTKSILSLQRCRTANSPSSLPKTSASQRDSCVIAGAIKWKINSFSARVPENEKAQICRLGLTNIVRCIMSVTTSMIASCELTRNIPVRCYV